MTIYEKIYLEACINNLLILHNQNIFNTRESQPTFEFSSIPKEGSDIHKSSNRKWILKLCTIGKL